MKSLLDKVVELDALIRDMQKINSKMQVGQFIAASREINRITAALIRAKEELIKNECSNGCYNGLKDD